VCKQSKRNIILAIIGQYHSGIAQVAVDKTSKFGHSLLPLCILFSTAGLAHDKIFVNAVERSFQADGINNFIVIRVI